MRLAHPLTEPGGLGMPPLSVALAAVVLVAAVLTLAPIRRSAEPAHGAGPALPSDPGRFGWARTATRAASALLLLGCIYAARRGSGDGLSNITPPLVVGVAWPVLLLAGAALPGLWRWIDPWGAITTAVERAAGAPAPDAASPPEPTGAGDGPRPEEPAWSAFGATVTAVAVMYFLVVQANSTQPRTIGVALAAYTIAMVAFGVAAGSAALARVEVFGLTVRWAGELRRRWLSQWDVPAGAEIVLGVLGAGMLFDLLRRSGGLETILRSDAMRWALTSDVQRPVRVGFLLACGLASGLAYLAERHSRRAGSAGQVAAALLPVVLALLVVGKLRRLLVSLQLLPIVGRDPLGRGWDLLGRSTTVIDPNPFGTNAQRWFAVALLTAAGITGAVALRRRIGTAAVRGAAAVALYLLVGLAVLGVTAAP